MISFPGLGKEELGEEWGGKGGRGGEWHRGAHIKNAISREGERRLVMNYAPPNARVKLRNCPHEYTKDAKKEEDREREGWAMRIIRVPFSSKQNVTGEECDFASS